MTMLELYIKKDQTIKEISETYKNENGVWYCVVLDNDECTIIPKAVYNQYLKRV